MEIEKLNTVKGYVSQAQSTVDSLQSVSNSELNRVLGVANNLQQFGTSCLADTVLDIPIGEFFDGMNFLGDGSAFDSVLDFDLPSFDFPIEEIEEKIDAIVSQVDALRTLIGNKLSQLTSFISEQVHFSELNSLVQQGFAELGSLLGCASSLLENSNDVSALIGVYNPEMLKSLDAVNYAMEISDDPVDYLGESTTRLVAEQGWDEQYGVIEQAMITKKQIIRE